jgi:hypothetical protein
LLTCYLTFDAQAVVLSLSIRCEASDFPSLYNTVTLPALWPFSIGTSMLYATNALMSDNSQGLGLQRALRSLSINAVSLKVVRLLLALNVSDRYRVSGMASSIIRVVENVRKGIALCLAAAKLANQLSVAMTKDCVSF